MPLTRIKLTAIADGGITAAKLANPLNLSSFDVTLPQGVGGTNWTTTPILTPTSDNSNDVPGGGSASGTGYLLSNSSGYFVNTGNGTVTVKLPANPQQGNYVSLVDYAGTNSRTGIDNANGYFTNRIQINPNGSKINGSTDYKDIGASRGGVQLVYVDSTQGWIVTDAANENTVKALLPSTPRINVGGILNADNQAYFQDTEDPLAGRTITITGSGFMEGATVDMIDSTNPSTSITPTSITDNQIVFVVPDSVITTSGGSGASFDDRFDIKVNNSNGSFVLVSDALQYAPRPNFSLAADTNLGTVSHPNNTISGTSYETFASLTNNTILATSLDVDDTITYELTDDAGLTELSIDPNSGALTGTQTTFPTADTTQNYTIEITAKAKTRTLEDSSQPEVTFARNFVITLEGEVSAPTITNVSVDDGVTQVDTANLTSITGQTIRLYGTFFKQDDALNDPTIVLVEGDDVTELAVNNISWQSATEIRFDTTSAIISRLITLSATTGDERLGIKITNPNNRTGGYGKSSAIKQDVFEYIEIGVNDFTPATSTSLGTVDYQGGDRDFTSLTTSTISAAATDPNDTITYAITSSNIPSGATVSIDENTGVLTATFPEGITANSTGNSFEVTATATGESGDSVSAAATYLFDLTATGSSFYTSTVGNSLRFDGSSYLSRPFTGGNQLIHTISMWVKRATLTPSAHTDALFSAGASADTNRIFLIGYETSQKLLTWGFSPDAFNLRYQRTTSSMYRDLSAWYHIVVAIDYTNQTGNDRVKLYVNGVQITSFDTETTTDASSGTSAIGHSYTYYIGRYAYASQPIIKDCYLANIQFIDGQALSSGYFGKYDSTGTIWIPKAFDGTSSTGENSVTTTYGTNGFHLDFSPASIVYNGTTITQINDVSGNNNHWAAN